MAMPKGFKSDQGYATVSLNEGGMGYREIAELMTESGFKMNHSTARNVFLSSMSKFARELCELYNIEFSQENVKKIASDPRFQTGVCGIISEI